MRRGGAAAAEKSKPVPSLSSFYALTAAAAAAASQPYIHPFVCFFSHSIDQVQNHKQLGIRVVRSYFKRPSNFLKICSNYSRRESHSHLLLPRHSHPARRRHILNKFLEGLSSLGVVMWDLWPGIIPLSIVRGSSRPARRLLHRRSPAVDD